jgi:hypothetical protein
MLAYFVLKTGVTMKVFSLMAIIGIAAVISRKTQKPRVTSV